MRGFRHSGAEEFPAKILIVRAKHQIAQVIYFLRLLRETNVQFPEAFRREPYSSQCFPPELCTQFLQEFFPVDFNGFGRRRGVCRSFCRYSGCTPGFDFVQTPLFDHPAEAQALHDRQQLRCAVQLPGKAFRSEIAVGTGFAFFQRHFTENRCQPVGTVRIRLTGSQFLLHPVLDVQRSRVAVNLPDAAVAPHQIHRCLFPDSGNARDVVGTVAHQGFQVHHQGRFKAVFLAKTLRRIQDRFRLAHAAFDVADRGTVTHQLQAVLVTGDDEAVVSLLFGDSAESSENVVGFVSGQFQTRNSHGIQHFLEQRHLDGKLLRHRLPLRFIKGKALMAESRLLPVEGHAQRFRLQFFQQMLQDRQKTVNRIGRGSVRGIQLTHAVKGAVYNAVAVNDHKIHNIT